MIYNIQLARRCTSARRRAARLHHPKNRPLASRLPHPPLAARRRRPRLLAVWPIGKAVVSKSTWPQQRVTNGKVPLHAMALVCACAGAGACVRGGSLVLMVLFAPACPFAVSRLHNFRFRLSCSLACAIRKAKTQKISPYGLDRWGACEKRSHFFFCAQPWPRRKSLRPPTSPGLCFSGCTSAATRRRAASCSASRADRVFCLA